MPHDDGLDWLFDLNGGAFRRGDNAIYYPWVANGDDFGLGVSQTSISVQNLDNISAEIGIFVGNGAGDFDLVETAFLSPYAAKTFHADDLGIAEGSGAPVAVLAISEFDFADTPDEDFPDVTPGEALVETEVILSKPAGVEGDFTQVLACVVNDGDGNPVGFVVAAPFSFDGVDYEAGDVFAMSFTPGDLQAILEDAQDGGELVNPFGGLNDDADCNDEGIAGELGESILGEVAIGGVAKQAVVGANLPNTSEADTAVSGYNAVNGSEVFHFDQWYLPIVQTNCGPGGCWDTVIRVANLDGQNNAVTIRFFPADDGSGSLATGFQIQDNVDGGATWNVNLGDLVPDGWVGSAHIFSDGAVFALADRYKVGYDMWITNTGSSADFENLAQVDGANGRYALFAPHVLLDYFGWNTGINVANLVNADNNISIQYFNLFGNATQVLNQRLAAHGMTYFYDPSVGAQDNNQQDVTTDPNAGVVGSAIIWSDSPVAAAVDATKYPETDPDGGEDLFQATSYSATQNIFTWQAVPLVQKGDPATGMGDTSGINIMNPNATAVTANVYFVNPSGFDADNFGVGGVTIPGFANGFVYTLWQHNLPNGFVGAAQVIASQPVAAVSANVNYEVDGDGSAIFNAFNPCGFFRVSGECTFGDVFAPGGQSVTKTFVDTEGNPIAGVNFSIVSTGAFAFQRDGVSGVDGSATFSNVPVGTYELFVNDVPGDFIAPDPLVAVDQFVVTAGADVVLENVLEFAQGFIKFVCIQDRTEGGPSGPPMAICSDIGLVGVQVNVYEIIGQNLDGSPVVSLDPVFEGETGDDGTVSASLPSGDYILCIFRSRDTDPAGGFDDDITTTNGEEVEVDLIPTLQTLNPCVEEDGGGPFAPDQGDIFEVLPGEVTFLENAIPLSAGILNVFVFQFGAGPDAGVETPVAGVEVCLNSTDPEDCATTGADGTVSFFGVEEGDHTVFVQADGFIVVGAEGGDLTVEVTGITEDGASVTPAEIDFNYNPTFDLVQDGFIDDDGVGTPDLNIELEESAAQLIVKRVLDTNGNPVEGASVTLDGTDEQFTDEFGEVSYIVEPGTYTICSTVDIVTGVDGDGNPQVFSYEICEDITVEETFEVQEFENQHFTGTVTKTVEALECENVAGLEVCDYEAVGAGFEVTVDNATTGFSGEYETDGNGQVTVTLPVSGGDDGVGTYEVCSTVLGDEDCESDVGVTANTDTPITNEHDPVGQIDLTLTTKPNQSPDWCLDRLDATTPNQWNEVECINFNPSVAIPNANDGWFYDGSLNIESGVYAIRIVGDGRRSNGLSYSVLADSLDGFLDDIDNPTSVDTGTGTLQAGAGFDFILDLTVNPPVLTLAP